MQIERGGGKLIKTDKYKGINHLQIIFILISLLLGACVQTEQPKHQVPATNEKPQVTTPDQGVKWKLPIAVPEGEFDKFFGWLSDSQVLYVTNLKQASSVFVYDLFTGKSRLMYKTQNPIVNVQISPSKKYLLIHSAPSSYEGLVTIINLNGKEQSKQSFPSHELVFEWNLYNEAEVLITTFEEDWSFKLFLLDTKTAKTTEIFMPQPFVKWLNGSKFAFLNWNDDNPSLVAPLIVKDIENESEKAVLPAAIQFSTYRNLLMTISPNVQDQSLATYSFFDQQMKKLSTFSIPQLTKFSDWLVPFNDYNEQKGEFITFSPLNSGEADSYTEGFQLRIYEIRKGRNKIIMEGMENAPISFSPSGNAVLYGNQLEKIINLDNQKIYDLFKE